MDSVTFYNKIFSKRISSIYDRKISEKLFRDESTQLRMREVISAFYNIKYARCLDLGVGTGANIQMGKYTNSNWYGCDISMEMLKLTKQKNLPVNLFVCDLNYLPITQNAFDIIIGTEVLHHVEDYESLIESVYGLLRAGGILYIDYEWYSESLFIHIGYAIFIAKLLMAKVKALMGDENALKNMEIHRMADFHYFKKGKKGFSPDKLQQIVKRLPFECADIYTHFHTKDSAGKKYTLFWRIIALFDNLFQVIKGCERKGHYVSIIIKKKEGKGFASL